MFAQANIRVDYGKANYDDLYFSAEDRQVLRELAKEVAAAAAQHVMAERKELWRKHNDLESTRPLILADPENGWNEIIGAEQIRCRNNIAQYWEFHLRKQLFWGRSLDDDFVLEAIFELPHVYSETAWGVKDSQLLPTKKAYAADGGAYHIDTVLTDYERIEQITKPVLTIDFAKSTYLLGLARELFDGILTVRQHTIWYWSLGLTDEFAFLRGMENMMYDFYDEPEHVHKLMHLLTEALLEKVGYLEREGLFQLNNDWTYVGSGGLGFTRQLPGADFTGEVRAKDLWLLLESQITVGISPEMFAEFIWPYQKRISERFGLLCYGCCEPLDARFPIVKTARNLRRVSVSPWADRALMAEQLGKDYIYSMKLSPSPLALPVLDEKLVRQQIRAGLHLTRENHVELIMKDNHTLGHNPHNLVRWTEIAREEVNRLY